MVSLTKLYFCLYYCLYGFLAITCCWHRSTIQLQTRGALQMRFSYNNYIIFDDGVYLIVFDIYMYI